jgi:hypothetical protein
MAMWQNEWGDTFETEEEARDNVIEQMDWDDFKEYMQYSINWNDLFEWARKQEGFFEEFENQFCDAENEFFEQYYSMIDNEE